MRTQKEIDRLYDEFPDRLTKILIDKGMTYGEVTKKMPVSHGQVQKWCEGISRPDMLRFMILANTLEVSADELLGFKSIKE